MHNAYESVEISGKYSHFPELYTHRPFLTLTSKGMNPQLQFDESSSNYISILRVEAPPK